MPVWHAAGSSLLITARRAAYPSNEERALNNTLKSFSIVTVFSVLTRLMSFLFKIWMSRSLGAETVGLYQIALSVILLLFSLTGSAGVVLSRKIAAAAARGDTARQNSLVTAALAIGGGVSLGVLALLYACSPLLGHIFADERCIPIFLIMLPVLVTSSFYAPLRSWFWGRKKFVHFSATEFADELFKIAFALVITGGAAAAIGGAQSVALALTLSDIPSVALVAFLYFRSGGRLARPRGGKEIVTATLPLSAVRILSSLSASLTALVIPSRLVAGGMDAALATAEYGRVAGMALPLIMAPVTVIGALSVVLTPDIAELAAEGKYAEIRGKLQMSLLFAAIVAAAFFAVYAPLGTELGIFFFGDTGAGEFVSAGAAMIFPLALTQVTSPVLNSLGMEKVTLLGCVCGLVCTIPCIFLLPSVIGIYSVAAASGIALTVTAAVGSIALARRLGGLQGAGKAVIVCLFSLPLSLLGFLLRRLLSACTGEFLTILLVALPLAGLLAAFLGVFGIVDIKAFFSMALPSRADFTSVLAKRKHREIRRQRKRRVSSAY